MALSTKGPRERQVLMGGPGAGKTRAWLSIADLAQKTGSDAHFYVVDTDFVVEYMISVGFPHLENVTYLEVVDWQEYLDAVDEFQRNIKPGDWMIGDLYDNAWEAVQEWYAQEAYGKDMVTHFIERKKKAKKLSEEGWDGAADWNIIKPEYKKFANRFFLRHRGHTMAVTTAKALARSGKWSDSKENVAWFDHIGFRPGGEKKTSHLAHTVLFLKRKGSEDDVEWFFSTGKDREREMVEDVSLGTPDKPKSFAKKYLIGTAGWTP